MPELLLVIIIFIYAGITAGCLCSSEEPSLREKKKEDALVEAGKTNSSEKRKD